MKKLDTYIAKQIVTGFLLVALSLMSMLWLTQSLRFVEMVTDKGLPVYLFVEMTSLLMPRVFTILSPIALFVAVMFVYNRLITDSELVDESGGHQFGRHCPGGIAGRRGVGAV